MSELTTTAEDLLEGIERVIVAAPYAGHDKPAPVYFPDDEAGMARRDADRIFTVMAVSDVRLDKRSGGSIYRALTATFAMQHARNKKTRRKQLADALVTEDALRHLKRHIEALSLPVYGVHAVRILSGPNFDNSNNVFGRTKSMTLCSVEVEYATTG